MRKSILALALTLLLLCCGACALGEGVMTPATVPVYYAGLYGEEQAELQVYFKDGNTQIPYFDTDTVVFLMNKLYQDGYGDYSKDTGYQLQAVTAGKTVTFVRENGYTMVVDFDADTLAFRDYDMFVSHSFDTTVIELSHSTGYDAEGQPAYLQRVTDADFSRYGDELTVNLGDYDIHLIAEDGAFYIPAQTMNDVLLGETYTIFLYNGEACFFLNYENYMNDRTDMSTGYTALFYGAQTGERSQELIDFTYNELCLNLDLFYGFKDSRSITSFDDYFEEISYNGSDLKSLLKSTDPLDMDKALRVLTRRAFDDGHSNYRLVSCYTGADKQDEVMQITSGASNLQFGAVWVDYNTARKAAFPDGVPGYQEVGNTAYITFDNFTAPRNVDYYSNPPTDDTAQDNFGLLIYATGQIRREDSPIENVVLDLSRNTGGMEDAAAYVCAWLLGEADIYLQSSTTGASAVNVYRCDANLDHVFDEKDTVSDLNLYCLISPVSFSCGNLVPCMLKASGKVVLVGRQTGGGSCVVHPVTTASGSFFQISGYKHISSMKNGSFYDADQGVEPDVVLTRVESFYDREALTELLNSLK